MRHTWRTQQTPKPAAQLPCATPPYWAHSVLKSIFWFWLTIYNHVNHKMLLKNPRVTLMSTWCSMCHCPLCLPRTLHCQTSPRWSGSGTWNIQFYHLKILTKIWVVQLPGVPLPWLCKALRGKAARQENHWDHQTNFYHHAEEKATTYLLLQQILTSGRWPPHPMFLFFVGNCIYTYKGLSISFLELKPNLKSDSFVVNFSS